MENSYTFLERISYVLIFCMAISALHMESSTLQNTITSLKDSINNKQVLYEQPLEAVYEEKTSYAEIIGILMEQLPCDMIINGLEISKEGYDPHNFDFSKINITDYNKVYEVDNDGNIVKVIYTS